ncbi:hypothetical protein E2C01_054221 [Portunus trituberculatus]|uniref:Uncharacterized protein n=1 Tax=Portunus trituberculatus TaxID=210409 RepID=A0A5B7GRD8_PORTR|nr:hypothetical protein [Portunus trituberculatus]
MTSRDTISGPALLFLVYLSLIAKTEKKRNQQSQDPQDKGAVLPTRLKAEVQTLHLTSFQKHPRKDKLAGAAFFSLFLFFLNYKMTLHNNNSPSVPNSPTRSKYKNFTYRYA